MSRTGAWRLGTGGLAAVAIVALLGGLATLPFARLGRPEARSSRPAAPRTVTLVASVASLAEPYPMLTLPGTLGYWRDEGYDVDVHAVGSAFAALQQLVAGNADLAVANGGSVIQSDVNANLPVKAVMTFESVDWAVAVPESSNIRTAADLRGARIGMGYVASIGRSYLQQYLHAGGLDIARDDIRILPLGVGAAPAEALRQGRVDGLLYWGSAVNQFRNAGLAIRELASPAWPGFPDLSLVGMQSRIAAEPEMVAAVGRGMAKAIIFARANPVCAVRLQWKRFPSSRPSNLDEATALARAVKGLDRELSAMERSFEMNGARQWGAVQPQMFGRLQAALLDAHTIRQARDPRSFLAADGGLLAQINQFDAQAIRAEAVQCKGLS